MDIIDRTIAREGGFVDHPEDPGGATNMGITRRTLGDYLGREATVAEVRDLTRARARAIYHEMYMERPGFAGIDDPWLRELLFDAGVLLGPGRPVRWLQEAAGVAVDGVLGPNTRDAANAGDPARLGLAVAVAWLRHHGERVQSGASSHAFIGGWINRVTAHLQEMPGPRVAATV